jgi:hypothetical protein
LVGGLAKSQSSRNCHCTLAMVSCRFCAKPSDSRSHSYTVDSEVRSKQLDIATRSKIARSVARPCRKLTIVMVAHRLSALANCDQPIDLATEISAVVVSTR